MANVKISDLSALSTQAAADLLAIVDDSASATKKITLTNFFDGVPVAITTTSDISGGTVNATSDTAASDNAAMGYTAAEGLILTGQGSTSDITIKNDADASVITIATGTTNVDIVGDVTASTVNADGDTAASDNAAMGYTAAEGLILTGQGSTSDVTVKNDADAAVITIATGTTNVDVVGDLTAATLNADGDTAASDNAAIGYTAAEGIIVTGQGSTNDVTIKNDADADVIEIPTGTTRVEIPGTLVVGSNLDGDGQLHVHSATAGSVTASSTGDELVLENSAGCGISILTPTDQEGGIFFGDPDDNDVMSIRGDHADNLIGFYANGTSIMAALNNAGHFFVGKASSALATAGHELQAAGTAMHTRAGSEPLQLNRLTNDGKLISFHQATSEEGDISVSGTTVSLTAFVGAHPSQWSLTDAPEENPKIGTIVKSTDEYCEWLVERIYNNDTGEFIGVGEKRVDDKDLGDEWFVDIEAKTKKKQRTVDSTKEKVIVEEIDGKLCEKVVEVAIKVDVFEDVLLFNEDGSPKMVDGEQATYSQPVWDTEVVSPAVREKHVIEKYNNKRLLRIKVSDTKDEMSYGIYAGQQADSGNQIVWGVGLSGEYGALITGDCSKGDWLSSNGDGTLYSTGDTKDTNSVAQALAAPHTNDPDGVPRVLCILHCG